MLAKVLVLLVVVTLIVTLLVAVRREIATGVCLRHGYGKALLSWGGIFCVRTVNGTTEVVPVEEVGR